MKNKGLLLSFMLLFVMSPASSQTLELTSAGYVCKGAAAANADNRIAFSTALLWALEQEALENDGKMEGKLDIKKYFLVFKPVLRPSDANYYYEFEMGLKADGGKMQYEIGNACHVSEGMFGEKKRVKLNKIDLTKTPQRQAYIDQFAEVIKPFVAGLEEALRTKEVGIGHWDAMVQGRVVKGMTEQECRLVMGNPLYVTENQQRKQWTYQMGKVVVFEKGIVVAVI